MKEIVRLAQESDLNEIGKLTNQVIMNTNAHYDHLPWDLKKLNDWWNNKIGLKHPVFVCYVDNEFAGFATYGFFRQKEGFSKTVEHSVYVAQAFQGRGIGKKLLGILIHHATTQKVHSMIAAIDSENTGSIAFHESFGFQEVGRIPQAAIKFDKWRDLVFLQKILG